MSDLRILLAVLLLGFGGPALAHQTFPAAIWNCVHDGDDEQPFSMLQIERIPVFRADGGVTPLFDVNQPFECQFPWGTLSIEIVGYKSPGDERRCGLAEAWGISVRLDGTEVYSEPTHPARDCFAPEFRSFYGSIKADVHILEICKTIPVAAHQGRFEKVQECSWHWENELNQLANEN